MFRAFYGKLDTDYTTKTGDYLHITAMDDGLAFEIEGQRFSFSYRELADRIDRLILQGIYPFSAEDSMLDDYAIPDEADEMNGAGKELEDMGGQPEPLDGEQTIADFLRLGSGVSGGKQKIYRAVLAMQSKKDRQVFIKQEYGWYSISSQGRRLEATPTNGIMIEYRTGEQHFRQQLSWAEVERHIVELVRQDVYLTEEEKKN